MTLCLIPYIQKILWNQILEPSFTCTNTYLTFALQINFFLISYLKIQHVL